MMSLESREPWRQLKDTKKNINSAVTAAGNVASIFDCAQGTAENQRIGNAVNIRHIGVRFFVYDSGSQHAATPTGSIARVIILIDHQTNGTTPSTTDILDAASVNSWFNDDNEQRFEVIYDKTIKIDLQAQTCTAVVPAVAANYALGQAMTDMRIVEFNMQHRINYSGTGANLTNITSGSLLTLYLSSTGTVNLQSTWKVWYED